MVFSWPAVSGLTCSALERLRMRASGRRNSTSPGSRCSRWGSSSSSGGGGSCGSGSASGSGCGSAGGSGRLGLGRRQRGDGGLEEVGIAQRAVEFSGPRPGADDDLLVLEVGRQQGLRRVGIALGLVARARRGAQRARGLDHLLAGGAQHPGDRRAGEQQQGGAEQEDGQDVGADVGEQARAGVGHDLAEVPAALGDRRAVARPEAQRAHREPQARGGEQAQRARAEGPHPGGQRGAHDEQGARGHERHRRGPRDAPDRPRQAVDDGLSGLASLPPRVEREGEEDADGHQAEADQVEVALLEDRQARRPRHRRAPGAGLLRAGLRGLAGRGHRGRPSVRRARLGSCGAAGRGVGRSTRPRVGADVQTALGPRPRGAREVRHACAAPDCVGCCAGRAGLARRTVLARADRLPVLP